MGVLARYAYDNLGRRASVTFGNGVVQNYGYAASLALASLVDDLPGTVHDQQLSFTYSASGQMREESRSNDAYAWRDHYNIDRLYALNGLNRILTAGQLGIGYDGRGNLTSSGGSSFGYDADNHLVSAPGAVLSYDPAGRLYATAGATTTTLRSFPYRKR